MIAKKGQHKGNAPSLHLTFFPHYSLQSAYFLKHNHMAEGYQIPCINMSPCLHNQTMFLSLFQQLKINFRTQLDKTWFSLGLINTQDSKYQYVLYQPRSRLCGSRKVSQHQQKFYFHNRCLKSLMSNVTVSLPTCRMVIFAANSSCCDWCNFLCNWSYFQRSWSSILDCSGSSGVQSSKWK